MGSEFQKGNPARHSNPGPQQYEERPVPIHAPTQWSDGKTCSPGNYPCGGRTMDTMLPGKLTASTLCADTGFLNLWLEGRCQSTKYSVIIILSDTRDCMGVGIAQSVQRLATVSTVRGSNPGGGEIFRTCPHPLWGPHSLPYNEYRVFPGGKSTEAWRWSPTPSSAEVKERVKLYLYSPSKPSWPVLGWTLPLPFTFTRDCIYIYIYLYINCNWVVTRWQYTFTHKQHK
jgi:hypothetical protein